METSTLCGLWGWRPIWLQRFARKEVRQAENFIIIIERIRCQLSFRWLVFTPSFMTKCNDFSAQIYILLYSVLGAVQGMGHTYLSSVLTTIEKQFGIKSQEAAWIFSGNEISQIAFILVLPFLRRLNKRILWTSLALMVSSLGIFLCALPYFLKVRYCSALGGLT